VSRVGRVGCPMTHLSPPLHGAHALRVRRKCCHQLGHFGDVCVASQGRQQRQGATTFHHVALQGPPHGHVPHVRMHAHVDHGVRLLHTRQQVRHLHAWEEARNAAHTDIMRRDTTRTSASDTGVVKLPRIQCANGTPTAVPGQLRRANSVNSATAWAPRHTAAPPPSPLDSKCAMWRRHTARYFDTAARPRATLLLPSTDCVAWYPSKTRNSAAVVELVNGPASCASCDVIFIHAAPQQKFKSTRLRRPPRWRVRYFQHSAVALHATWFAEH